MNTVEHVSDLDRLKQKFDVFNQKVFNGNLTKTKVIVVNKLSKRARGIYTPKTDTISILKSYVGMEDECPVSILAHEMCHAATYIISKDYKKPCHGKTFFTWAQEFKRLYNIPVHTYTKPSLLQANMCVCNSSFKTPRGLSIHMSSCEESKFNKTKKETYNPSPTCFKCNKSFNTAKGLKIHINRWCLKK